MTEEWITTSEACKISGYHPYYLRELLREGKIEGKKFGTIWQVNRTSLLAYIMDADKSQDGRRGPR